MEVVAYDPATGKSPKFFGAVLEEKKACASPQNTECAIAPIASVVRRRMFLRRADLRLVSSIAKSSSSRNPACDLLVNDAARRIPDFLDENVDVIGRSTDVL